MKHVATKFRDFSANPRIPWMVASRLERLENRVAFFWNRLRHLRDSKEAPLTIVFKCGFHVTAGPKRGAVYAIANTANQLAQHFCVEFATFPDSAYNRLLSGRVALTRKPRMDADIYICDNEADHEFFEHVKRNRRPIVITCHGFLDSLHGLDPRFIARSMSYADRVQLVNSVQRESFGLSSDSCRVIPNASPRIYKTRRTRNIGTVGNLDIVEKNADETVRIGLESEADEIHIWSASDDRWRHARVKVHSWESDKKKIYDSFDVLVFLSQDEALPMVVIEAMSAGIPCVLSSIPAFKSFEGAPGVAIIDDANRSTAPQIVNDMLNRKDELRSSIIKHWQENYSEGAVSQQWTTFVTDVVREFRDVAHLE